MLLIVIAGLAGLFGNGPASARVIGDENLRIAYSSIERLMAPATYKISTKPYEDKVQLIFSSSFLEHNEIKSIMPEPESAESVQGALVMEFKSVPERNLQVKLDCEIDRPGRFQWSVRSANHPELSISQFILP